MIMLSVFFFCVVREVQTPATCYQASGWMMIIPEAELEATTGVKKKLRRRYEATMCRCLSVTSEQ